MNVSVDFRDTFLRADTGSSCNTSVLSNIDEYITTTIHIISESYAIKLCAEFS